MGNLRDIGASANNHRYLSPTNRADLGQKIVLLRQIWSVMLGGVLDPDASRSLTPSRLGQVSGQVCTLTFADCEARRKICVDQRLQWISNMTQPRKVNSGMGHVCFMLSGEAATLMQTEADQSSKYSGTTARLDPARWRHYRAHHRHLHRC